MLNLKFEVKMYRSSIFTFLFLIYWLNWNGLHTYIKLIKASDSRYTTCTLL